jgi:uncharacterized protein YndB with AHSA1/START domain
MIKPTTLTRSVTHSTFVVERTFKHPPAKVFAAFADPAAKAKWFGGPPAWGPPDQTHDFRVGGGDTSRGGPKDGPKSSFVSRYYDIIPDERIIYTYEMHLDDRKISVSLATVELFRTETGTRLVITEAGAYLDGYDDAGSRERGTNWLIDKLGASLDGAPTPAPSFAH